MKDPAMLWYWNDWHSGTSLLSRFLKGCYIDLLHAEFNNGRLSLEEIKICLGSDFAQAWVTLQKKFKQDEKGLFFNERLEREKFKREEFSKSRKKNIAKRYATYEDTHVEHMNLHMDNINRNENINENSFLGKSENPFLKTPELWTDAKRDFLNAEEWQYSFCIQKGIDRQEILQKIQEFITDLELKEEYKDLRGLKSHFTNWFNKQKKQNAVSSKQSKQELARQNAIRIGQHEFAALREKHSGN